MVAFFFLVEQQAAANSSRTVHECRVVVYHAGLLLVMESQESQLSHQWEMLLGTGVQMKTVVRGGGVAPDLGSQVLFNWIGRVLHEDGTVGVTFAEREGATARIGDGDEIPGQVI